MKLAHAVADLPDHKGSPHAELREVGSALFTKLAAELHIVTQKKTKDTLQEITSSVQNNDADAATAMIRQTAESLEDIRIFAKGNKPTAPGKITGPQAMKTLPFMTFEFRSFISFLGDLAEACVQSASLHERCSEGDVTLSSGEQTCFLMFADAAADGGKCPRDIIGDADRTIVNLV